jgi:2-phospho-L-lactate guanylyltransferase
LVVLAKDTKWAKTRLGIERARARALAVLLAGRTVLKAMDSARIESVFVVTSDPQISVDAVRLGANLVPERRPLGINQAADLGRRWVLERRPDDPVGIVVADLPVVQSADFDAIAEEYYDGRVPLFVPDHRGEGTTMLVHGPAERPGRAFGLHSADMHRRLGYEPATRAERGLRLDLDTADDLALLARELRPAYPDCAQCRDPSEAAARPST